MVPASQWNFIPTFGSEGPLWDAKGPLWDPVELICLFPFLSVSLYLWPVFRIACWRTFKLPLIAHSSCSCKPRVLYYNLYSTTLSPHWGPRDPRGVQSILYVFASVYLSVLLFVSLSGHPCRFLAIICAACNCIQRMRPQATGSNLLSGSMICPSVRLSSGLLIFFICINSIVGVPSLQCICCIL